MTNSTTTMDIKKLLAAEDKRQGFPSGTMASLMRQESGGSNKFLADPSAYHYGLNADGKRIAGHTGKVSTAFGPFGILESTAAKPGYGVKPLTSKDFESQLKFAGNYLKGRAKSSGSLSAGLSGYGEGDKYANQVIARIPQTKVEIPQQVALNTLAQRPQPIVGPTPIQNKQPQSVIQEAPPVAVAEYKPEVSTNPEAVQVAQKDPVNAWAAFLEAANSKSTITPEQLAYAKPQFNMPEFVPTRIQSQNPNAEVAANTGFMQPNNRSHQAMTLLNRILNDRQDTYTV